MHGLAEVGVHHWLRTFESHLRIGLETGRHCPALSFEPEKSKNSRFSLPKITGPIKNQLLLATEFPVFSCLELVV